MTAIDYLTLVVNPAAGAGRANSRVEALTRELTNSGFYVETIRTQGRGDATRIVRDVLHNGPTGIGVVGGDGSLNEAVNGFFEENGSAISPRAWLAPFPAGTGGDFCRGLGLPDDLESLVARVVGAVPSPIDVGWVTYTTERGTTERRAFLNIASVGLSAVVVRTVERMPKQMGGRATYFLGALLGMTKYSPTRMTMKFGDDTERTAPVLSLAIANSQYFGGGMRIAPPALTDDGWLDVVGLENMSKLRSIAISSSLYDGSVLSKARVTHQRVQKLEVRAEDNRNTVYVELDGESPGQLPASFSIQPGSLLLRA